MADESGRVVWLWGPLLLVAVLVAVFQFAETGGVGSEAGEPPSALAAGEVSGAAAMSPPPGGATRPPAGGFAPHPGYPPAPYAAGPGPYPGMQTFPPWGAYGWPPSFPRPGDHSGRYWGGGAAEWGPPIGEYGPDTRVDPYWWVTAEEDDR